MFTRRKLRQLADDLGIPRQTIAAVAGLSPSNVSAFMNETALSESAENRIAQAVRDIVALLNRFNKTVRPDLSDGPRIKDMVEAMKNQAYSVMILTEPPQYFLHRAGSGQVAATQFFLRSAVFHFDLATVIAHDLVAAGVSARAIPNQYAGPDRVVEPDGEIRETLAYKQVMGIRTSVAVEPDASAAQR